jgi:hypothetical protein
MVCIFHESLEPKGTLKVDRIVRGRYGDFLSQDQRISFCIVWSLKLCQHCCEFKKKTFEAELSGQVFAVGK